MNPAHKHHWTRSKRQHKRAGRFFVECECGETRQASISAGGKLKTFLTGADRGGATVHVSFRLDKKRFEKLRRLKIDVRSVIEKHLDEL